LCSPLSLLCFVCLLLLFLFALLSRLPHNSFAEEAEVDEEAEVAAEVEDDMGEIEVGSPSAVPCFAVPVT